MPQQKAQGVPRYPVRRFFATRALGAYDVAPDGLELAFVTNLTGATELFRVPSKGGWPDQLTFDAESIAQVAYSPDGKWLAFLRDRGGDENYQLHLLPRAGGTARVLTGYPQSRHLAFIWGARSKTLYYTANRRNPRVFDVYRYDLAADRETLVLPGPEEGDAFVAGVSNNERELFHVVGVTNLRYKVYRVDTERRQANDVTPGREKGSEITVHAPHWVQSRRRLYFLTNNDADFHGIGFLQMPQARFQWHRKAVSHEISDFAVSEDGAVMAWSENRDGSLVAMLERGGRVRPLSAGLGTASRLAFSRDGRVLAFVRSTPSEPHEIHCLDLRSGKQLRSTRAGSGAVPARHLVTPELVHYPSFDRRTISAFLYLPPRGKPPYPTLVWPHGGPEHQELAEYRPRHQFFANQGFAVFVPNFRGSTGYGQRFQRLIYRDWGGGHYRDVLWGVRHLIRRKVADPRRLGVYGGSFGGYTTLWAVTQDPDLWKAAVAVVAPSNLITLIESTHPSWRKSCIETIGDPEKDREFLRSRSPLEYVDSIRTPLLVLHGANDPRVKRSEADQIVERLRSRGIPVEYRVFEGEGHGWRTIERTYEEMDLALDFLNWHLNKPVLKEAESKGAAYAR